MICYTLGLAFWLSRIFLRLLKRTKAALPLLVSCGCRRGAWRGEMYRRASSGVCRVMCSGSRGGDWKKGGFQQVETEAVESLEVCFKTFLKVNLI